jgi:hypothetical protein
MWDMYLFLFVMVKFENLKIKISKNHPGPIFQFKKYIKKCFGPSFRNPRGVIMNGGKG